MNYNYQRLYNKNAQFLEARPLLRKGIVWFNTLTPYLFIAAYLFLWVYGAFLGDFSPKDFLKIFFLPALALLLVTVLRLAIDRPRPFSEEGAGITPLKEKKGGKNSFPSRHLTCAAVISLVCFPYLTAVSALLFLLTVGMGYTRFALGWHYPSDLLVGFLLGVTVGGAVFFF